MPLKIILTLLIGYLIGSANAAIIVCKFFGVDIKSVGSKNAGLTNVLRCVGKSAALITLVVDILKGVVACLIGGYIFGNSDVAVGMGGIFNGSFDNGMLLGGFAAVLGHIWPLYFRFKGGKGVLTTIVVLMVINWKVALTLILIFVIIVALTRYVSLGSIIGAFLAPFISLIPWYGENDWFYFLIISMIAVLVIVRHAKNIVRLVYGKESKLSIHKESKEKDE